MRSAKFPSTVHSEGEVMTTIVMGIDLAKNVFAVHGVDEVGRASLVRPSVKRADLRRLPNFVDASRLVDFVGTHKI
jgi:hypothetical protein